MREAHVPDEDPVARLRVPVLILEQEVVIGIDMKAFFRELLSPPASFADYHFLPATPLVLLYGKKAIVKQPSGSFEISLASLIASNPFSSSVFFHFSPFY